MGRLRPVHPQHPRGLLPLHHRLRCSSRCAPPRCCCCGRNPPSGTTCRYGFDLLTHRVIKVNGNYYCVTPDFFSAAYRDGQLEGTMVFSETCEFFGGSNILDLSMSNALLDAGARTVVGFVNNVYAVYSRNMLWGTVNQLIMGQNILQAVGRRRRHLRPRRTSTGTCPRAAPNPTATRPLPWSTGTTPPPSTPWTNARRRKRLQNLYRTMNLMSAESVIFGFLILFFALYLLL